MKPKGRTDRPEPAGRPMTGRVVKISHGQGHGFIQVLDRREVFFHRADTDGTFNKLEVDDVVTLELLEDRVSGARALRVRKKATRRASTKSKSD